MFKIFIWLYSIKKSSKKNPIVKGWIINFFCFNLSLESKLDFEYIKIGLFLLIRQIFLLACSWFKHINNMWLNISQCWKALACERRRIFSVKHNSLQITLGCLSLDSFCSSRLIRITVFLELSSWKTVSFSEQIMVSDKIFEHIYIMFIKYLLFTGVLTAVKPSF